MRRRGNDDDAGLADLEAPGPMMDTETACIARANPYDVLLEISEKHKTGWYLFNLIISDSISGFLSVGYPHLVQRRLPLRRSAQTDERLNNMPAAHRYSNPGITAESDNRSRTIARKRSHRSSDPRRS